LLTFALNLKRTGKEVFQDDFSELKYIFEKDGKSLKI